jgi:catechol 2,3-dioxygenase-like lactoylglutathione lyase family enzyme
MINGAHVIFYSRDAEADRAFIRDVLGFANVDAGDGWLIFKLPPAEVAVHPADGQASHELHLMCDDIEETLATLAGRGVKVSPVAHMGWGARASIGLPSGSELGIYQPRHPIAHS